MAFGPAGRLAFIWIGVSFDSHVIHAAMATDGRLPSGGRVPLELSHKAVQIRSSVVMTRFSRGDHAGYAEATPMNEAALGSSPFSR